MSPLAVGRSFGGLSAPPVTCPYRAEQATGLAGGYDYLVGNVGKKSSLASALDSGVELALVLSAGAGDAAGKDLAALADELSQLAGFLVVDIIDLICAEYANFFSLAESVSALNARGFLFIHYNYPILS